MGRRMGSSVRKAVCAMVLGGVALLGPRAAWGGAPPGSLQVFAPWSLEKRLRRIVEIFQERCPATPVRFTTGTPGQLIKKVKAGARPGVYIAMGPAEIEVLDGLGVTVDGTARPLLEQRLVLAVAEEARERVKTLSDLAKPEIEAAGIGRPVLTSGRRARAALAKAGVLEAVAPKARTSPLRSLIVGDVPAAVIYEECCYEEDLHVGAKVPRRGIAVAIPLPGELCKPFPVIAVALSGEGVHPHARQFIEALTVKRA
ncbi:MAG: molybdate ABC transporter substrate-binding protein, partial [Planctomycetota bacterium]